MVISFNVEMGPIIEQWTNPTSKVSTKRSIMIHESTTGVLRFYGVGRYQRSLIKEC